LARAGIVSNPIDVNRELEEIAKETTLKGGGAIVLFMGYVKGLVNDSYVYELDYEAYEPYASKILNEIASQAEREEGVLEVRIYHRVGSLKPGEPTVYVIVAAKTRHIAFRVAEKVLEEVKHKVPIFKLEKRSNGEYWVIGNGRRVKKKR